MILFGTLRIVNGEYYIDEVSLKKFVDKSVEIEVHEGRQPNIDPAIMPLVMILNQLGYRTIASCQGHLYGEWTKRPNHAYVTIVTSEDRPDFAEVLAPDWIAVRLDSNLLAIRTIGEIKNLSDIEAVRAAIDSLVTRLVKAALKTA